MIRRFFITLGGIGLALAAAAGSLAADPPKPLDPGTPLQLAEARPPAQPPSPISSHWRDQNGRTWHLTSWEDKDGDGKLSRGDVIDLTLVKEATGRDFGPRNWALVIDVVGDVSAGNAAVAAVVVERPRPNEVADFDGAQVKGNVQKVQFERGEWTRGEPKDGCVPYTASTPLADVTIIEQDGTKQQHTFDPGKVILVCGNTVHVPEK